MGNTTITVKCVSSLKHLEVTDVANVEVRQDVKKLRRILGESGKKGVGIKNTWSTQLFGAYAETEAADEAVKASTRIDATFACVGFIDRLNDAVIQKKIREFHDGVASLKKALYDKYGETSIPAEAMREYYNSAKKLSVSYWSTQIVVTRISDEPFDGGVLNPESGKYHATCKTKSVVTSFPIHEEYLTASGVLVPVKAKNDKGEEVEVKRVSSQLHATVMPGRMSDSQRCWMQPVVNELGEKIFVFRRKMDDGKG